MKGLKNFVFAMAIMLCSALLAKIDTHAADTIEGYIHTGYGSFDRTYTVQVSNYTGNITILHPYIVEYKSGSNETWVTTVEVIMSDEPFSKYFVNRDFGASAVNTINAITGCYTATSGTLTCASWSGNGNMPDSYVMEGTNWLDITDSGISLSDSDIPGKILQYLADNDLIDVSENHVDDGEYSLTPVFVPFENVSLDVPKIRRVQDSNLGDLIYFDNASDDYLIEVKGRWYSIDDIELYKENAMWIYRYNSIIHNALSDWCSINTDRIMTHTGHINRYSTSQPLVISSAGSDSFNSLLSTFPVESRSYSGGTNAVGNYFSGYSDALSMLKSVHLNNMFGDFNSYEIYVRYVYVNGTDIQYSKWAHFYTGIANPSGSSGSMLDDPENLNQEYLNTDGLTSEELSSLESTGNSRGDAAAIPKLDFAKDWSSTVSSMIDTSNQVFSLFEGMFGLMGSVPSMVNQVFGFLPSWFSNFIAISLALVVLMRFVGR